MSKKRICGKIKWIYVEKKTEGQQLEAYTGFAAVYDIFMDNVPYEEWGEYIHSLLKDRGIEDGILLDLGLWHRNNDREACGLWI